MDYQNALACLASQVDAYLLGVLGIYPTWLTFFQAAISGLFCFGSSVCICFTLMNQALRTIRNKPILCWLGFQCLNVKPIG